VIFWCVEHLHRLPEEVTVPFSALIRGIMAHKVIAKKLEKN